MKLVRDSKQLIEDLADQNDLIYDKLGIVKELKVATNYHERLKEGKEEQVNLNVNCLEKRLRGSLKIY